MYFKKWFEEEADIPKLVNGEWVDIETGIPFSAWSQQEKSNRKKLSSKASSGRGTAKLFGGKALTGTAKQKEWAEKIREEKIRQMSEADAIACCNPNGLLNHSKFWIENRDRSSNEIAEFNNLRLEIKKSYEIAAKEQKHDEIKNLAEQYNSLTSKWGF